MKNTQRQTISMYPDDWAVVEYVEQQYNVQRSQALRFIINDYRLRHNIPVVQPQDQSTSGAQSSQES